VDNTIIRDNPTLLPLIPATSVKGVLRYAAFTVIVELLLGNRNSPNANSSCNEKKKQIIDQAYFICDQLFGRINAGDSEKEEPVVIKHSAINNAVLSSDEINQNREPGDSIAGIIKPYDALPVLFPVPSSSGPVWITVFDKIRRWLLYEPGITEKEVKEKVISILAVDGTLKLYYKEPDGKVISNKPRGIRLGWLYLAQHEIDGIRLKEMPFSDVATNVSIVPDHIFSRLVNDNLDVRTSVKIDDLTGAAEAGALFTYESIPRLTVLEMELAYPNETITELFKQVGLSVDGSDFLHKCLNCLEVIGVGGYSNKGAGRIKLKKEDQVYGEG
jgi:CRISPR-associated protein Cmr4